LFSASGVATLTAQFVEGAKALAASRHRKTTRLAKIGKICGMRKGQNYRSV
jgi:hypothetical protein